MIKFSKCTKIFGSTFGLSFIGTILSIIHDCIEYDAAITAKNCIKSHEKEDPEFRTKCERNSASAFKVHHLGAIEDDEILKDNERYYYV